MIYDISFMIRKLIQAWEERTWLLAYRVDILANEWVLSDIICLSPYKFHPELFKLKSTNTLNKDNLILPKWD